MYPENWTGHEDSMLCQGGEEERGRVDTADTGERGVPSPCGARSAHRTENGQRTRSDIRGAPDADGPWEPSPPPGEAGDVLGTTGATRARRRGMPRAVIPTNWATPGGGGLADKKSGTCRLRPSGSCVSLRL